MTCPGLFVTGRDALVSCLMHLSGRRRIGAISSYRCNTAAILTTAPPLGSPELARSRRGDSIFDSGHVAWRLVWGLCDFPVLVSAFCGLMSTT